MRNEAGLRREPAAEFPRAPRIDHFLAVKEKERKGLLGMLDVGQLADRRARLPAGGDTVTVGKGADRPADGIDEDIAVALAPLVGAAENRRRPLAGAADAHDVLAHLG